MDESPNNDYVNPMPAPAESPDPPVEEASLPPADWRDGAAFGFALVLSLLYWATFSLPAIFSGFGPGLGVPVFVCAFFAAVLVTLGKKTRWRAESVFLMAVSVLLSLCCALYAHEGLTVLNCFIILATASLAVFSLSGQLRSAAFTLRALADTVRLFFIALFGRIDRPFKLLRSRRQVNRAAFLRGAVTAAVTIVILGVVLALLASADMVFESLLPELHTELSGTFIWKIIRTAALTLFISSGLYFIREDTQPKKKSERTPRELHVMPFLFPTALLDVIYLVFCAVQLRYLFGGAEAASMAGGWAEYARTGFFQLVAVAGINLALCLAGADKARFEQKGGLALRLADGLMLLLTAVILLSAARRMQLYILAFGLSVLRIMTLWGMLIIAAGLLMAAWKLYAPDFAFARWFGMLALGSWCLFCLCSPAGMVANYNVNAYLDGRLTSVDVDYLEELTTDAAPALKRLAENDSEYVHRAENALAQLTSIADNVIGWVQMKGSFLYVDK